MRKKEHAAQRATARHNGRDETERGQRFVSVFIGEDSTPRYLRQIAQHAEHRSNRADRHTQRRAFATIALFLRAWKAVRFG